MGIKANGNSPITRSALRVEDLFPNNAISALLNVEKGRSEMTLHPSIRKFKAELPPLSTDPEVGHTTDPEVGQTPHPTTVEELEGRNNMFPNQCAKWAMFFLFSYIFIVGFL